MLVALLVAVLLVLVVVFGLRWYLNRAKQIEKANSERRSFQDELLLSLQDARDVASEEAVSIIDSLIELARYETPASNQQTELPDEEIIAAAKSITTETTIDEINELRRKLESRNRRAKRTTS